MLEILSQSVILLCGLSTVFLSTAEQFHHRKWASLFGMTAQPFWLYDSYTNQQWGILLLSILFAGRWTQVFIRDWIKGSL